MGLQKRLAELDKYQTDEVRLVTQNKNMSAQQKASEIFSITARYDSLRKEARNKYGMERQSWGA